MKVLKSIQLKINHFHRMQCHLTNPQGQGLIILFPNTNVFLIVRGFLLDDEILRLLSVVCVVLIWR